MTIKNNEELGASIQTLEKNSPHTPMMAQYFAIKKEHRDCLLFYRMGDFYELFFEDAVKASAALDIVLTKRGKHIGSDIPMCGVPVQAADTYISRLIRSGYRVAICEQVEDPSEAKRRGSKSVVAREVVRVVTPGTLTEDTLLERGRNNYLAAIGRAQKEIGVAWIDISTGEFFCQGVNQGELFSILARVDPREILVSESMLREPLGLKIQREFGDLVTFLVDSQFDSTAARGRLESVFAVASLDAFGAFTRAEVSAAGALLDYIDLTQKGLRPRLDGLEKILDGEVMEIDLATRRNLEITRTLSGEFKGSLNTVIDVTTTGAGKRLLTTWLSAPLTDIEKISHRHDSIEWQIRASLCRGVIRTHLRQVPDISRSLARLTLDRGGPRDLAVIRDGLKQGALISDVMRAAFDSDPAPELLKKQVQGFSNFGHLIDLLDAALDDNLPLKARDGGFIAKGFSQDLDELVGMRDLGRDHIMKMQLEYARRTGVPSLKIKHNNVLGYFIELTAAASEKIPHQEKEKFIHRQTLVNAVRYTTLELTDLESRISRAAAEALALEQGLFQGLIDKINEFADDISGAADGLAHIDVISALSELAVTKNFCRPILEESSVFDIKGGWHPVVEAVLAREADCNFIPNDCSLNPDGRLWLLTGPNMAGKSTFLRQNAIIAILAQAGSFVPAAHARIGIVDRLFSRVGASDDLARGRSTFMNEMVETAAILNRATERSLIILDEIGRGTATFDGLSIAWSVLEYIHEVNKCRALFATHFHELTILSESLPYLKCHTMRVKEWRGDVVFLHEVIKGAADRSYGIHVGTLAGLPSPVIKRAKEVLNNLESEKNAGRTGAMVNNLPLFRHRDEADENVHKHQLKLANLFRDTNPDSMTPREALEFVYRLKELVTDF
jgi:DNA mismatch repair protein MutS